MSKEGAANFLGLKIEGDGDNVKFVKNSGEEVTHDEAMQNVLHHRKMLKSLSQSNLGFVSSQREWAHLKFLGYWIEIQNTLEKMKSKPEVIIKTAATPKTHMPSIFENEDFREMMEIITHHHLFKIVDTTQAFGHTVNCLTCGELSISDDQQFHTAHMLYDAGFRKIPEVVHSDLSK